MKKTTYLSMGAVATLTAFSMPLITKAQEVMDTVQTDQPEAAQTVVVSDSISVKDVNSVSEQPAQENKTVVAEDNAVVIEETVSTSQENLTVEEDIAITPVAATASTGNKYVGEPVSFVGKLTPGKGAVINIPAELREQKPYFDPTDFSGRTVKAVERVVV